MLVHAGALVPEELAPSRRARLIERSRHAVSIGVLRACAVAAFDDALAAQHFALRYRDLQVAAGEAVRTYAACDDGECWFWSDDGAAYRWPHGRLSPRATAFLADAVTSDALLGAIPSAVALHAAALRRGGRAFAITGLSTAGKSTTALACVAAGCRLYSDERCLIVDGDVVAYPRALNGRADGLALLADDLPDGTLRRRLEPRRGADWENVPFAALFDEPEPPAPAPLAALFAICGHGDVPATRPITHVEMLAYAHRGAKVGAQGIDRVRLVLELLERVPCYELVLGAPYATALHLIECVEGAR
jgi:hypothetical protein